MSNYRSFTTPAQISAYCEALTDRYAYSKGRAPEMHLTEPGIQVHRSRFEAIDWDQAVLDDTWPG